MAARPITFLSDYGHEDEFAGVCRAVIARIAPEARVIDLAHGIPRHDIRGGAIALVDALPYTPPGVHLAVVDPGVGTDRRGVAVRVVEGDRILVGPDNGLLSPALDALGGATEAVDLVRSRFRLETISATFHGRDIFAPVAARLALGASLAEAGDAIDPATLVPAELPEPRVETDRVVAHALVADQFGNLILDLRHQQLQGGPLQPGEPLAVEAPTGERRAIFARAFGDLQPGELLLYVDSSGRLALAVNRGSAAELLGARADDEIILRPA